MDRPSRLRKAQADEYEMVRELVRVCCETLLRGRKVPLHAEHQQPHQRGLVLPPKSLWFNLCADVLLGVESMVNTQWRPNRSLEITFSLDSTLLESWSIRYASSSSSSASGSSAAPAPVLETRYLASTLLVRQLIVAIEALPAAKYAAGEYTCAFVERGQELPLAEFLAEEFALPAVDMAFGKVFIQVRYRGDVVVPRQAEQLQQQTAAVSSSSSSSGGNTGSGGSGQGPQLSGKILEDYIPQQQGEAAAVDAVDEAEADEEDDDAGNQGEQRWKRWTSEAFAVRERQLLEEEEDEEEEEEERPKPSSAAAASSSATTAAPLPPSSSSPLAAAAAPLPLEFVRQTSNPMTITKTPPSSSPQTHLRRPPPPPPPADANAHQPQITRKLSSMSSTRSTTKRLGSFRLSSSEDHPVTGLLVGTPPNASSLPHLLGSLAGSDHRTRFLSSSFSPSSPAVLMSAGSLMIYNKPEHQHQPGTTTSTSQQPSSSGGGVEHHPSVLVATTDQKKDELLYESALPWILTAAEMERPFSGLAGSIYLGTTLDSRAAAQAAAQAVASSSAATAAPPSSSSRLLPALLTTLDESESFGLPFGVAEDDEEEDEEGTFATTPRVASSAEHDDEDEDEDEEGDDLGAFLLRCREAPPIFEHEPTVRVEAVQAEFEVLVLHQQQQSVTPAPPSPKPSEVVITQVNNNHSHSSSSQHES